MLTTSETAPSAATVAASLARLRAEGPVVHNITNYVVMNTTANALLAIGASPAMVHAEDEVDEFVAISRALVINIGTLSAPWVASMTRAAQRAAALSIPWVLDPVGAGATTYRTRVSTELARTRPSVIRGNASELMALAGATEASGATRGVDSVHESRDALGAARELAASLGTVVAVTGAVDYVTDGERAIAIANGDPLMARVTGLGCTASALVGAFLAVDADPFDAAVHALASLGVAGGLAAARAQGPGTLQLHLYDALHQLDAAALAAHARIAPA